MTHKVLLRFPVYGNDNHININDQIGLDAFSDYSLEEYIEDRLTEGVTVIERCGCRVYFSDGESGRYEVSDQPAPVCGDTGSRIGLMPRTLVRFVVNSLVKV